MTVRRQQPWEIRLGDCVAGMQQAVTEGVKARLVFADPPYNQSWIYDPNDPRADDLPDDKFLSWCREWMELLPRVLTPDGSAWILISDEYYADFRRIADSVGFHYRQGIVWFESFGVNCSRKFNRTHRHILHLTMDDRDFVFHADAPEVRRPSDRQTKYGDRRANPAGKLWDSVWGVNPAIPRVCGTFKEAIPDSPAPQLPLALLRPIIAVASDPGDLVIDPFTGNATTGVAALQLERRFLGWELREPIHRIATRRMEEFSRKRNTEEA